MDTLRLRAVLITADRSRAEQFHACLMEEAGFELLCVLEPRPGPHRWSALLAHTHAECILLDATDQSFALEILRQFQSIGPHSPIVAFAGTLSPQQMLPLLRAGAFELFDMRTSAAQMAEARARLIRHLSAQPTRSQHASGTARVAAFTASKPGAGASTLARHTAGALRRITGQRVLLVDLNPQCALAAEGWDQWNGISLDPPPPLPMTPATACERLRQASAHFDWIIADLPCAASRLTLSLAPELANIVLTATPDLAGIHMTLRSLHLLARAGAPEANVRLALNRITSHGPLRATDIEAAIKHKVEWKVPDDYRRLQSSSEWGLTADSALAQSIRGIASGLVNGLSKPPRPAQFLRMSRCEEVLA